MNRNSVALTLDQIQEFLERDGPFLLTAEAREHFRDRTTALLEKARSSGELLYVGILGGTGVGKSTLINALARREISSPSDRRPFTDRAVVYRHKDTVPALDKVRHLLREPDALHDSDGIRDLVLMDLPDFDSQDVANRRTVLEILPALDCAVWVVSPEKYADAALYKFVKQTAMNQENFTFVLNKSDELLPGEQGAGHRGLKEVLGDFGFRLRHEAGIDQPRVFSVSALTEIQGKAGDAVLRSEFRRFRDFLMAGRDAKEIASIKTVNLLEESRRLLKDLNSEVQPERMNRMVNGLDAVRSRSSHPAGQVSLQAIEQQERLFQALYQLLTAGDVSVGPVRLGMKLLTLGRSSAAAASRDGLARVFHQAAAELREEGRPAAEQMADRLDAELVLAFRSTESFPALQEPDALMDEAEKDAAEVFSEEVDRHVASKRRLGTRLTRVLQKAALFVPVVILGVKLAGPEAVAAWMDSPTVSGAFMLMLGLLTSLFGSDGLIGLIALLICELFLVGYLAARRLRTLEKTARALARSAVDHVQAGLDSVARRIDEDRGDAVRRIRDAVDRWAAVSTAAFAAPQWKNVELRAREGDARLSETQTEGDWS